MSAILQILLAIGAGITTLFSTALSGSNADVNSNLREVITLSGPGQGKIRVKFTASSAGLLIVSHAGVGISTGTLGNCVSTPIELLFGGVSGFSIAANASITSDWLTFSITGSQKLVVTYDTGATGSHADNGAESNSNSYVWTTVPNWNTITLASPNFTGLGACFGVAKVETSP